MSNLKKKTTGILIGFLLLLFTCSTVHATVIGSFNWDEDMLFGPFFSVQNSTTDSFFDVFVDLQISGGGIQTLSLGDIPSSMSGQSIDDLTGLNITSAALRLTYPLPGFINVSNLTSLGDVASINYTPSTVPEPSVILLLSSGLAGLIFWKKSRR